MVRYLDNNGSGFAAWNANKNAESVKKPGSRFSRFLWWFILFLGTWWLLGRCTEQKNDYKNPEGHEVLLVAGETASLPVKKISSDKISADVRGLRISNVELLDYKNSVKPDDVSNVTLLDAEKAFAEVGLNATGTVAPDSKTVWKESGDKMTWRNADGVVFSRTITTQGYLITVTDTIDNKSKKSVSFSPYVRMVRDGIAGETTSVATGVIANVDSKIKYVDWNDTESWHTENGFIGFADQYWETIANINQKNQTLTARYGATETEGKKYVAESEVVSPITIAPSDTGVFTTTLFMGPRDQVILDAAATTIGGIDKTVDYGWFWFFAQPILWLLNIFNSLVMNYGVAIILMTILLRLLMWPLTRKSYASTLAMQKMQPEMQRIQKLYANDKARLQMEMMNLYKTHKTSPMSGCLPMLLQIPIFFALYKALLVSVQMRSAGFLWIQDLAVADPYFILPVLMGITMWLQQYLQTAKTKSNESGPMASTQKFMKFMPVIFTLMCMMMPAGLVLYWTVSNIFGIIQMYIIKKHLK
ncbi:MAG: membrane protein insertase YidC [Alphaproteobacteria bacterium]|nr:membrane protein insertase YidC [Alphaproteobacteria bacterium]